ncbi:MmgE/PrpD family protein [Ammonicoccus fulvus]|uniref:MmgE/PrpD family protein n=1 Tax=Ammonicoccus fulvus TaxID=3138240 RepID=A0ABZ3FP23_9ACTN
MDDLSLARALVRTLTGRLVDRCLPSEPARVGRTLVADSVGITLAAATEGLADRLQAGLGAPGPVAAAFVHSAMAHTLDFDDIHDRARLHATTVTFPAALAVAQDDTPWDEVVAAAMLGSELMCRIGAACAPGGTGSGSSWFLTQLLGYAGAALASGLILGLKEDALVSALGLAYMQSAGGKEPAFGVGSSARSLYPAFAAMGGVTAARLASVGVDGPEGSLDGIAGLLPLYLDLPVAEELRARLLRSEWVFPATLTKPWPCCRLSHSYVAAALQLGASSIDHINTLAIGVNASAERLCVPLAARQRPATLHDAKYSIPFVTAATLVHGPPRWRP